MPTRCNRGFYCRSYRASNKICNKNLCCI